MTPPPAYGYRGRIAPSPTGYLHLGHARTFWTAQERCRAENGTLLLRIDDLDGPRCQPEFVTASIEDLRWFGFHWDEGPDIGGAYGPYLESERMALYRDAFDRLRAGGFLFPCSCSRRDVLRALSAPHEGDEEPVYPGTCRSKIPDGKDQDSESLKFTTWRFRVPDGEPIEFDDGHSGRHQAVAGKDFGDFLVWRKDGFPSYQLACVVDDALMRISEVVRGEDLITSTFRQLLLYRALGWEPPRFYHCPLVKDSTGKRLAKRNDATSLRSLRAQNLAPDAIRAAWIDRSKLTF